MGTTTGNYNVAHRGAGLLGPGTKSWGTPYTADDYQADMAAAYQPGGSRYDARQMGPPVTGQSIYSTMSGQGYNDMAIKRYMNDQGYNPDDYNFFNRPQSSGGGAVGGGGMGGAGVGGGSSTGQSPLGSLGSQLGSAYNPVAPWTPSAGSGPPSLGFNPPASGSTQGMLSPSLGFNPPSGFNPPASGNTQGMLSPSLAYSPTARQELPSTPPNGFGPVTPWAQPQQQSMAGLLASLNEPSVWGSPPNSPAPPNRPAPPSGPPNQPPQQQGPAPTFDYNTGISQYTPFAQGSGINPGSPLQALYQAKAARYPSGGGTDSQSGAGQQQLQDYLRAGIAPQQYRLEGDIRSMDAQHGLARDVAGAEQGLRYGTLGVDMAGNQNAAMAPWDDFASQQMTLPINMMGRYLGGMLGGLNS